MAMKSGFGPSFAKPPPSFWFGGSYSAPPPPRPAAPAPMPAQPSAQMQMPRAQQYQTPPQYQAYQPQQAQQLQGNIGAVSQAGQGLLDPNSDYYQRLSQAMQRQIGGQSAAQQRAAALRGAYSGFGAGAAPETMSTAADIAQSGLEAQGRAEAGLALQAPQMGAGMLAQTYSPLMGLEQLGERSRQFGQSQAQQAGQFGASLGEQQRQFGTNVALQQQQMAGQQAWQQAQLQAQQQRAQQEALMRQMSMMFGML